MEILQKKVSLTQKEYCYLKMLAEGKRQTDIANKYGKHRSTIGSVISRIVEKLGAHTPSEAIIKAYEQKLL